MDGPHTENHDPSGSDRGHEVSELLSVFDELAGFAVVAFDVDARLEAVGVAAVQHRERRPEAKQ